MSDTTEKCRVEEELRRLQSRLMACLDAFGLQAKYLFQFLQYCTELCSFLGVIMFILSMLILITSFQTAKLAGARVVPTY